MNFAFGVIAAVGILIAISLGMIAADPTHVPRPYTVEDTVSVDVPELPVALPTVSLPEGTGVPGCESTNECFIPYNLSVNVGDTVTWTNDDTVTHTVTSGMLEMGHDGIFDSGLFPAGAEFTFMFEKSGEYDYFCLVHPWMTGKVTVI